MVLLLILFIWSLLICRSRSLSYILRSRFLSVAYTDERGIHVVLLIPASHPRDSDLIVWIAVLLKLSLVVLISSRG